VRQRSRIGFQSRRAEDCPPYLASVKKIIRDIRVIRGSSGSKKLHFF